MSIIQYSHEINFAHYSLNSTASIRRYCNGSEYLAQIGQRKRKPNNAHRYRRLSDSHRLLTVVPATVDFDKRLRKTRYRHQGTMLVTNNTTFDISRIKVRFRYTNYETGELLHQRDEWLDCEIPAGATRSVDIASFDRHRRFYYYLSPRSRRQATPFAVAVKILRYDIIATATD